MKISNKITIVSMAGALALIGTAFAAWQFNASVSEANATNVDITKKTSSGSIADVATFYLTLDQSGVYWTNKSFDNSEASILDEDKVSTFAFVYTGSSSSKDVTDVILSVSYVADDNIAHYVSFTGGELVNIVENENVKSATYNLPSLAYTSYKPSTSAAYDEMKTALEGKKVTFTLTASVSE